MKMFNPSQGWIKRCLAFILALNRHVNAFPAAPRNPLLVDQRFLLQKNPFTAANHYSRQYFTTVFSQSTTDDAIDIDDDDDDENARSQFGTRQYWDDLYLGRGDFPADEYSWYFGWEILQDYVQEYLPSDTGRILCPGIGNDSILVDLYRAKYHKLTAFDYSEHAIERQEDLLSFELPASATDTIELHTLDARKLPEEWTNRFAAIIEKGALDAIYLSGDGNVERAVENLHRVLQPGGTCLSVSGVVPEELRRQLFRDWEWVRDGSDELKAGCFVLRKPRESW